MNFLKKARLKEAIKRPILKDLTSLHYDNIGISLHELRKIENDPLHISTPENYAKIVKYFGSIDVSSDICNNCVLKTFKSTCISIENCLSMPIISKSNPDYTKFERAKYQIKKGRKSKNIFYKARIRSSLQKMRFLSIERIHFITLIPIKKLYSLENRDNVVDDFKVLSDLLKIYNDLTFIEDICTHCPVRRETVKIKEIKHKEEEKCLC